MKIEQTSPTSSGSAGEVNVTEREEQRKRLRDAVKVSRLLVRRK